jgi:hypothetical protein
MALLKLLSGAVVLQLLQHQELARLTFIHSTSSEQDQLGQFLALEASIIKETTNGNIQQY